MNKLEKRTILLNTLFQFGYNLASNFLSVYLFVYADSLITMSIYTIIRIGLFPVFFMLGNKITQRRPFAATYAIGLALMTCSLVYAISATKLFEINGNFVLIAAAITGVGEGFYWYSSNTCNQIVPSIDSRAQFLSINGICSNIISLVAPFVATQVLKLSKSDLNGYRIILYMITIAYLSVIFVALKIDKKADRKNSSISQAMSLNDDKWRKHIEGVFFYGLRESLGLTLMGILLYNATGSGKLYSRLQMVFAIIGIVFFRMLTKFLTKDKIKNTFRIGMVLRIASAVLLVVFNNMAGAIAYGVVNALACVLYDNSYSFISANIIATYPEQMSERVVAKEIYLSISRCTGMAIVVLFYLILPEQLYLIVSVILLSLAPIVSYNVLINAYNKYIR